MSAIYVCGKMGVEIEANLLTLEDYFPLRRSH